MRNAPWDADDVEILRNKWRLANETANACEKLSHKIGILAIQASAMEVGSTEHDEKWVEAKKILAEVGEGVLESGLTKPDWMWFVQDQLPDELDRWKKHIALFQQSTKLIQQSTKLNEALGHLEKSTSAVASAKQKFADAIRLSLNAREEADPPNPSWFQEVDEGVRIHGRVVKVKPLDAKVLSTLCGRTQRVSNYRDLADEHTDWLTGLNSGSDKTIQSTKSSIRNSLSRIREAVRHTFNLSHDQDPVERLKTSPGWKLGKELLQANPL